MESVDYKKELKALYRQSADEVSLVEVPTLSYLMLDGEGDPNTSPEFSAAVETLYPFSYAIRSIVKDEQDLKYVVMPLEGRWWADEMDAFEVGKKDEWQWTLMIMQPDVVTEDVVERARENVAEKKDLPALSTVRFESFDEGLSAQTLHVGPFSEEGPTIERVHEYIEQNGYVRDGDHHEIYLSDMRRTDPEKLKTIVRQPVAE
ncbi:GyrI-like domain-containing protein [Haloferax sp. YSMS24]|uniref:GyrI-like domain-containing protein n=1 Tax=Haloferax sp. YSMS24 TaxID=3388425 RepID=UPI00398D1EC1